MNIVLPQELNHEITILSHELLQGRPPKPFSLFLQIKNDYNNMLPSLSKSPSLSNEEEIDFFYKING